MDMTLETSRKFVEVLASDAPAPGSGGLRSQDRGRAGDLKGQEV